MTPTAVTPAARRARPATPSNGSVKTAQARPASLRSGRASAPNGGGSPSSRTPGAPARAPQAPQRSPQRASSARSATHRSSIRRTPAPRGRRRVSGPAAGVASAAVAGGYASAVLPGARPRRRAVKRVPRIPSVRLPRLPQITLPKPGSLARSTGAFVLALPESSLLDRIIRGRVWIPLLGVLLVGLVATQVELLKLNAGLGSAIERTSTLQSRNESLHSTVAALSDEQRIETIAAQHGMVMSPPDSVKFLRPSASANLRAAIANIHAPGSTYFDGPVGTSSAAAAAASPGSSTGPLG